MKNLNKIEEEVEKTLGSIEGIKRAEANPYLYGRISSRMQTSAAPKKHVLGFVIVAILILLINFVTLISYNKNKPVITREQKMKAFIYDYQLENEYNINY
ncbi:MAG: hypothetical protein PHN88_06530 [Ignavibacteria bacterium]|nr:hypothetical protein [Ignavibacteria bacterium]